MTMTIDTLALVLENMLGDCWAVTARFDRIVAVTPLCDRILIQPVIYGYEDVRWVLVPMKRQIASVVVAETATTDVAVAIADKLRSLAYQHRALPPLPMVA
ncbi:hypothetical protein ABZ502_17875 [Streptomyces abikoensis]|uniref:hypothetical protein n=1 Tax=Streptomyces abikoensis TaxID=97398 RepID=UPI00340883D4